MLDDGGPGAGLGRSAREAGGWPVVGASLERVVRTGEAELSEDHAFAPARAGVAGAASATSSRIPILDPAAPTGVGGVLATAAVTAGGHDPGGHVGV